MIAKTKIGGRWHYSVESLDKIFSPRTGRTLALPLKHFGAAGEWLEHSTLVSFLKEYQKEGEVSDLAFGVLGAIRKEKVRRRRVAQLRRWDLAYKQEYRCKCGVLLKPSFEVDHIVELADGGEDCEENLQCLCRDCHGQKTRLSRQKRSKYFSSS